MVCKGFRFGLLLQIAIGPVCLFIFQTAVARGFFLALAGVLGVVIVDTSYILLAILGIGSLLQKRDRVKAVLQYLGAFVLIIFGLSSVLGTFGLSLLPSFHFEAREGNMLVNVLILTLSNPLTILFWAGVFATRLAEDGLNGRQTYAFGLGAVLSTAFFLSLIALFGSLANVFFNDTMIDILNAAVGVALILFGLWSMLRVKKSRIKA